MGLDDYAAINARGEVCAISIADGSASSREFVSEMMAQGHSVQRMQRDEAVRRLTAYLNTAWPEFAALPSPSPLAAEGKSEGADA